MVDNQKERKEEKRKDKEDNVKGENNMYQKDAKINFEEKKGGDIQSGREKGGKKKKETKEF